MARFSHTVTVAALGRGWFEEAAGALVGLLDASREGPGGAILLPDGRPVDGLRLLKGRHLRPGARYGEAVAEPEAAEAPAARAATVLREWRPSRSVEVESLMAEEDMSVRLGVRVREPLRPRAVEVSLAGHQPKGGSLYRFSGRAKADLGAWWAAVDRLPPAPPAARPPVSGKAVHLLGKARLTVTPRPDGDGSWQVTVALSARGRWLLRPVGAVILFFARKPVERGFREAVESAAREWNTTFAELTPLHGEALRAEIADALTEPGEPAEPKAL
ncbi:hypothetical protein RI138_20840 [Streptomyces sp. C11-1]|uniref:Uncharacterized protein n=1 Tax=Streptomyces durocortorensis TaxID=2811104 RepID=A0ABY9W1Y2_9ACTN|nr:hypothetical protein [Streptomyces durocortorensis]WNF29076.1 hypothetical protein RI138_20840 [Streptomyces durocortorensis]